MRLGIHRSFLRQHNANELIDNKQENQNNTNSLIAFSSLASALQISTTFKFFVEFLCANDSEHENLMINQPHNTGKISKERMTSK